MLNSHEQGHPSPDRSGDLTNVAGRTLPAVSWGGRQFRRRPLTGAGWGTGFCLGSVGYLRSVELCQFGHHSSGFGRFLLRFGAVCSASVRGDTSETTERTTPTPRSDQKGSSRTGPGASWTVGATRPDRLEGDRSDGGETRVESTTGVTGRGSETRATPGASLRRVFGCFLGWGSKDMKNRRQDGSQATNKMGFSRTSFPLFF